MFQQSIIGNASRGIRWPQKLNYRGITRTATRGEIWLRKLNYEKVNEINQKKLWKHSKRVRQIKRLEHLKLTDNRLAKMTFKCLNNKNGRTRGQKG